MARTAAASAPVAGRTRSTSSDFVDGGVAVRRSVASVPKRRGWLVRRMLALADVFGLTAAFALAELLVREHERSGAWSGSAELLLFLVTLPLWIGFAELHGLYKRDEERTDHSTADDLVGVMQLVTLGSWVFLGGMWLTRLGSPTMPKVFVFWATAIVAVTTARAAARAFCRRRLTYVQNTVVVGAGTVGQLVARKLLQHPEYGVNVVGLVDAKPRERLPELRRVPLLGRPAELREIVRRHGVERVVFAFSEEPSERTVAAVRSIKDLDVQIDIVPRLFELVMPAADIFTVEGIPLVGLPPLRLSRRAQVLKRMLDLAVASVGLVLLAPVLALIALLLKLDSPGRVLFWQTRVGTRGRVFKMAKFRTMCRDAEAEKCKLVHLNRHARPGGDARMFKIDCDPRVTRVGAFLRRYSLDELPQLINVLKGEMSLVGPRPLIAEEAQHVHDWALKRLDLKPGMTGLWQVLGRSAIPFEEMVRLDYLYVTNWSLWRDCLLLLRTLPVVARGVQG
jgi:exopolysaccharide biosynthesis polyprenyl glycosylphosphotransferase